MKKKLQQREELEGAIKLDPASDIALVPIIGGDVDTGVVDVPKHVDSLCDGEVNFLTTFKTNLVEHQWTETI